MTRDWEVMAVEVTTTPTFKAGHSPASVQPARSAAGKPDAVEERESGRPAIHLRHAVSSRSSLMSA